MIHHPSQIAVIGCGTWGTTLASLLRWKGYGVKAWDIDEDVVATINREHRHPKLNGVEIPDGIVASTNLDEVLSDSESIVIATISVAMREVMNKIKISPARPPHPIYTICTKGIEIDTLKLMAGVALDVLGENARSSIGVLSGPSHAEEVSRRMPTSIVASSEDPAVAQYIQQLFMTPEFRVYTQNDIIGVELGGAIKNVIAIASGVCDGLGFGDNSRAGLITRGLAEMIRLGKAMGAQPQTLSGLAGMGDLIVTCTSRHSRNRRFGELLVGSSSVDETLDKVGMVVEGMPTARAAVNLAKQHNIEMPIVAEVYELIYNHKDPRQAVTDLMTREAKPEIY